MLQALLSSSKNVHVPYGPSWIEKDFEKGQVLLGPSGMDQTGDNIGSEGLVLRM